MSILLVAGCLCLGIVTIAIPAYAEKPFKTAHRFIESGQTTEARRSLESELRMRPKNLAARYNLAILLEDIGHHHQAQELYKKNLAIGRHLPSLINLASSLDRDGKADLAILLLKKATRQFRSEATPWYLLAEQAEKRNNKTEAAQMFRKAIKTDPLNGFAYLHYADFQSRHERHDRGIKYAAKALRLLPKCAPCWRTCGDILGRAGKHENALHAYQRSLAIDPNLNTRQQLVGTLRTLGQNKRANDIQRGLNAHHKHQIKD